ncbi:MAG: RNA-guided endonuclease InsQ/TnpB family protein, partial [Candidatus Methanospirareceae archaeon]
HKIAKEIVEEAEKHNAIIAIGDLKGIRNKKRGRKANRKVNSMPSHKLKEYIRYKAYERGIAMIEVSEFNTSKQCSKCGSMNTERPSQGVLICKDCGYQINADVNGAKNILKRAMGYMLMVGAAVTQPEGGAQVRPAHSPTSLNGASRWKPPTLVGGGGHDYDSETLLNITIEEVGEHHGEICPCVASSFRATQLAFRSQTGMKFVLKQWKTYFQSDFLI